MLEDALKQKLIDHLYQAEDALLQAMKAYAAHLETHGDDVGDFCGDTLNEIEAGFWRTQPVRESH